MSVDLVKLAGDLKSKSCHGNNVTVTGLILGKEIRERERVISTATCSIDLFHKSGHVRSIAHHFEWQIEETVCCILLQVKQIRESCSV